MDIPQELVERMVALVRELAGRPGGLMAWHSDTPAKVEAVAIASLLPEPVDPDLIEAREFLILSHGAGVSEGYKRYARDGSYDDDEDCQRWLAAIKRGRELASKDTPNHG